MKPLDLEGLDRHILALRARGSLYLLASLVFVVGWWRAEVHNSRLAQNSSDLTRMVVACFDTSFTKLNGLETRSREVAEALFVGGPRALVEDNR